MKMLVTERLPQSELRKLATDSRILREHPDLASYYQEKADRLRLEAKQYEQFMREAGDTKPVDQPNHYAGRTARFDYLVAKDKLKEAREADILAALNEQAQQAQGCFTCHSLHGRGGTIGPDLGTEGTRKRSDAWLVNHFKDPQAYSPRSVMPSFGVLTGSELQTLAGFLRCQK
jgi:mono/diheme cytochrome c family protein